MVCLRQFGIRLELCDEPVVGHRLPDAHPREDRHEEKHRDDRNVVGRRRDGPKLMPVMDVNRPERDDHQEHSENGPLVDESSHSSSSLRPSAYLCVLCVNVFSAQRAQRYAEGRRVNHFFLATAFISDSSITGAGPEMPPSFLMRQKCTAINIDATSGIPMQCQMYERKSAFESTIDPPSNPKRTSL